MGNLGSVKLNKFIRLLKKHGFEKQRHKATSHMAFTKKGLTRPLIVPFHGKETDIYCIRELMAVLGITKEQFKKEIDEI
ncbi:MAG: type II toxin-antitoxin system HicA family toxin [Elusimicrobium sp.]|jgi:predicted RNA binding protein YcfA (HicA-like mRNA interferase family)|nr:type II toxin-antitoxin system HicA family toxin [Elusimicrobium sp.]